MSLLLRVIEPLLLLALPPKPHLRFRVIVQSSQKDLIPDSGVILHVVNFGQSNLPRRIALQLYTWSKKHKEIRLSHHTFRDLRVYQVQGDVIGGQLLTLRHLRQGLGQIYEG